MCGIAGLIDPRLRGDERALAASARAMSNAIAHRGPDGDGVWTDPAAGVALSHRRLAIIDLTPTGAQPMTSHDGRWVITYNGEIYNAADIAREPELSGVAFRGTSDTEVMVESVARRGLERTLADLNGMYALALWDRKERVLHLVRDRLGIKPLFLLADGRGVRFGSELKAIYADGSSGEIDREALASFLRFGYVPAPWSIFKGIRKVLPGEVVSVDAAGAISSRFYWRPDDVASLEPLDLSDEEAEEQLGELLGDAVSRQMISDVPLGAFLSGGIDSSMIVALMVAADCGRVRTFSIGFPDLGFDESVYAANVARHLGTDHTQLVIDGKAALDVIPRLADIYDEPFADSSQIPTCVISQLTREHVTVALSGDGGDELFAGYNRYAMANRLGERLDHVPRSLRRAGAALLQTLPDGPLNAVARSAPGRMLPPQFADKVKKFAEVLPLDRRSIYQRLVSQCADPVGLANGAPEKPMAWDRFGDLTAAPGYLERLQLLDTVTYLPDDILQKVDRASMAVALEVRPPLLDHRIVSFASRLPRRLRIRGGETKWLLRRVLDRYVPKPLIDRPKMGFGVPLADWLRGPLRNWAEDLLDPSRLDCDLINANAAGELWQDHVTGRRNWAYALWTILMFEAWRRRWTGGIRKPEAEVTGHALASTGTN